MQKENRNEKPVILFKYGGNAMLNKDLEHAVLEKITSLTEKGYRVIIVHGGGPFIKQVLDEAGIRSEFVGGHRITTPEALEYVEMALKGKVNGALVSTINHLGHRAVGLSGKDGRMVIASKRVYSRKAEHGQEQIDLGRVGNVKATDTGLIELLLEHDYIPVISCIAADEEGKGYNVNADMFAGHIAGAMKAEQFVVLTDVDGLLKDKDDPATLVRETNIAGTESLITEGIIAGGMIPKVESCKIALEKGAYSAKIINGTVPEQISSLIEKQEVGTTIKK